MTDCDHDTTGEGGLFSGILGTGDIIFMILACAAPMGVLAGIVPLAFAFGNGAGVPGTQLGMSIVMLLFAVGYVRIIPHVRNAGAFYAYIAASLNKEAGIAAAYTAVAAYICAAASVLGAMSYFAADLFATLTGIVTSWLIWAMLSIAIIAWLGYHKITMAAKVLIVALLLEVGLIAVIDVLILWDHGWSGLDFSSFSPRSVFAPGLGIAVIHAINGCIGFEATAIYQEEAVNRAVTIPRATYGAVLVLGSFYVLSSWCLVLAVSPDKIKAVAAADPGHLVARVAFHYLGQFGRDALNLLTITSLFAAALGFFNNISRYFFALSRDGLIPAPLGRVHRLHGSPYLACLLLACLLILIIGFFALAGLDPLLSLATSLSSMGAVGLEILLTTTSLTIPLFFARRGEYSWGKTAAPLAAGLIIAAATWLSLANYSTLTGTTLPVINRLPLLFIAIAVLGLGHGIYLRRRRPAVYARVGSSHIEG
ncbi:amino acid transporter [Novosphingobium sp. 1748]|uniref:APC family permease n=1 Tax=Novosphingobium sp. 1748 TaxID=2817760 RepID=UPI0028627EDC|nr:APC family permease [Novosphingobium sp. 1748]MDR6707556.1 amino acid transporter [Novosphingobium sp. 1748]